MKAKLNNMKNNKMMLLLKINNRISLCINKFLYFSNDEIFQ